MQKVVTATIDRTTENRPQAVKLTPGVPVA